ELVITWSQLAQNPEIAGSEQNKLIRDRSQLAKIVRDLQTVSMSMRLIPIKPAFQKMVRLIRDLSKKTGKEVEVELVGEETEVDKSIVELIVDPLMHMVRNSVDHGIETKAVRLAAGKPAAGKVRLSAYHKGGSIVIEVSDDGGGLNRERILKKAWERGLIPMNEEPPDSRIYAMIFEPGFSTAEKVTDVSGRGVGMDVVKRNIDKLRGRIDIETQAGSGSTFVIRLPLTLAMIDGLIFQVGRERYVAPLTAVLEMVRPSLAQIVDVTGKGKMIKVRENLYQLVSLAEYFGVPGAKSDIESMTACLMESDFGCVCLLVDEVIGQQQVVIKNLGERLKDVKGQAGGTILGDGRVGLILDINGIVRLARGE
ncbi:MAG: chemotaxis protein CheA, partial [Candidatus Omnitrophota bacterium]